MKRTKYRDLFTFIAAGIMLFIACGLMNPLFVTWYDVGSATLPAAFDGYKILQISDLQDSTSPDILPEAKRLKPDMIVLTGDVFYTQTSPRTLDWTLSLVRELTAIAPVYAVSGNHDLWNKDFKSNQQHLADAGAILLENTEQAVKKNGTVIHIMGITDPDTLDEAKAPALVQKYMQQVKSDVSYNILLFHRANLLYLFKGKGFDLILSGHLHGGQVRLPFFGGLGSPEGLIFPLYDSGLYQIDQTSTAVVSRGIGNSSWFPRIYNPPELVLVALHKK